MSLSPTLKKKQKMKLNGWSRSGFTVVLHRQIKTTARTLPLTYTDTAHRERDGNTGNTGKRKTQGNTTVTELLATGVILRTVNVNYAW